ncbi:MAG: S-adenosylmethionine decarboxylase [Candidatus Melainabacteria bacterium]|nr:S-adenosylmethionine decarboxylase [Candidatus Melainabacteria bacterium]MBI3307839.1 S-adenosylmethionine decarboxylase [Candidatus Melainabacteria bacterium]
MGETAKNLKTDKSYRRVSSIKGLKLKRNTKINRTHIIMDIYKCDDKVLAKAAILEQRVKRILEEYKLEPKIQTFYQFQPFGVTAAVFTQGVQFTLHTWPEHRSAAIDLYCFNGKKRATDIMESLKTVFKSAEYDMRVRKR